jgi:hypothetical protein
LGRRNFGNLAEGYQDWSQIVRKMEALEYLEIAGNCAVPVGKIFGLRKS